MNENAIAEADRIYVKRRRIFRVAMFVLVLAIVGTAAGTIYFFASFGFTDWTLRMMGIDQAEREILVELSDVEGEEIGMISPQYAQTWNRRRRLEGTRILYSGNRLGTDLTVHSTIFAANNEVEARSAFATPGEGETEAEDEIESRGLSREEQGDLFRAGDESRLELLRDRGQPAGFHFRALSGRNLLHVTVIGVPYETPEALEALLGAPLRRLGEYTPTPFRR